MTSANTNSGSAGGPVSPIPDYQEAIGALRARLAAAAQPAVEPPSTAERSEPQPGAVDRGRPARVAVGIVALAGVTLAGIELTSARPHAATQATDEPLHEVRASAAAPTVAAPMHQVNPGNAVQAPVEPVEQEIIAAVIQETASKAVEHDLTHASAATPAVRHSAAPLEEKRRKALRRHLIEACDGENYDDALKPGRLLQEHDALDWASNFCLATALQKSGHLDEARALYRRFVDKYPANRYVKDARRALSAQDSGAQPAVTSANAQQGNGS